MEMLGLALKEMYIICSLITFCYFSRSHSMLSYINTNTMLSYLISLLKNSLLSIHRMIHHALSEWLKPLICGEYSIYLFPVFVHIPLHCGRNIRPRWINFQLSKTHIIIRFHLMIFSSEQIQQSEQCSHQSW